MRFFRGLFYAIPLSLILWAVLLCLLLPAVGWASPKWCMHDFVVIKTTNQVSIRVWVAKYVFKGKADRFIYNQRMTTSEEYEDRLVPLHTSICIKCDKVKDEIEAFKQRYIKEIKKKLTAYERYKNLKEATK